MRPDSVSSPLATSVDLAGVLRAHADPIVAAWAELASRLPGDCYRSRPAQEIQDWVRGDLAAVAAAVECGSRAELERYAAEVSLARLESHFGMDDVIEGLLLGAEAALPFVSPLGDSALTALHAAFRSMVASFARQYAAAHQVQAEQLAVMQERQRLSRELHDSVTQSLYSLTLYADAALLALIGGKEGVTSQHLRDMRDTALEAMRDMRLLIFELNPPLLEEAGLVAALQARLAAVEARAGLKAELSAGEDDDIPLPVQRELYWIAQEALNNVLKHAQARQVRVMLDVADAGDLVLEVIDDGVGFAVDAAGGLGLRGIRERVAGLNGRFVLESQPGRGSRLMVQIPAGAWR